MYDATFAKSQADKDNLQPTSTASEPAIEESRALVTNQLGDSPEVPESPASALEDEPYGEVGRGDDGSAPAGDRVLETDDGETSVRDGPYKEPSTDTAEAER